MRFVFFYQSLVSDWNHGNAHFLRGVATELVSRGHQVRVFEPQGGWSLSNLLAEHGTAPVDGFRAVYPWLESIGYDPDTLDLDQALDGADVVVVHEWNEPRLVGRIGRHRARAGRYRLLFHDTHHRCISDPQGMAAYDLSHYDGVLAFGEAIRDIYLRRGWTQRAWTWHEAADTRVFHPTGGLERQGDLVWVGNWGDEERTTELEEFLFGPVRALGIRASIYGVRYPRHAQDYLASIGIKYRGWLPNYRVPQVFGRFGVTVHVPRRPYASALPGIPTIRVFEALACGIPLVCSPWDDVEGLFTPGRDFLVARDGDEMRRHLLDLLGDPKAAAEVASLGLDTVLSRHTCRHRVDELEQICRTLGAGGPAPQPAMRNGGREDWT